MLLILAGLTWLGMDQLRPPACSTSDRLDQFSCDRAMVHIRAIASQPHPAWWPANEHAREYLVNQLQQMGLSVRVQKARIRPTIVWAPYAYNIIATLPGTHRGPALMLACHYDSVMWGPGACDDGLAVGALLETVRALKAGPPLRNDVILLITDGEELGMRGAEGFVDSDPLTKEIGFVLNFDARGTDGPSIMFQTSDGNADIISAFASAAPYPVATSLAGDVYRRMPNDTDFTIFARAGMKGLNFAFIGNYAYYHTAGDNLEHLDQRTLAHTGSYALSLSRKFGNLDLSAVRAGPGAPDDIYFTACRGLLIHYREGWGMVLSAILLSLTTLALIIARRRHWITIGGTLACVVRLIVGTSIAALVAWIGVRVLVGRIGKLPTDQHRDAMEYAEIVFSLLAVVVTFCFMLIGRRRPAANNLAAAGLAIWALLAIPVTIFCPGGSYLVFWPAIAALIAFCAIAPNRLPAWARLLVASAASVPVLFLMPPSIDLFMTALTYRGTYVIMPLITLTLWLLASTGAMEMLGAVGHRGSTNEK